MTLPLFEVWYKTHDVLEKLCVCAFVWSRNVWSSSSVPGAASPLYCHFESTHLYVPSRRKHLDLLLLDHLNSRLRYLPV